MAQALEGVRGLLRERNVSALIVRTEDAHQSEYVADCDGRRAFISGFTGSAGTALITPEHALLWTDGRYFLQVQRTSAQYARTFAHVSARRAMS
jgi:Xaa-Pro aminopeptidase